MSNVTMTFTVQQANFISGVMKLQAAMDKTDRGLKKTGKTTSAVEKQFKRFGKSVAGIATGFLGAQGVRMAIGSTIQDFKALGEASIGFEKSMGGLLSLGGNLNKLASVKRDVLDTASAFGLLNADVADAFFAIQSGASQFSESVRRDIRNNVLQLVQLTNADLTTSTRMLTKAMTLFGETFAGPSDAMDRLFKIAELGDMTIDNLSKDFGDIMSTGKGLKFTFDEIGGGLVTATRMSGDASKGMTQYRNILAGMVKATEENVISGGRLVDMFGELANVPTDVLLRIFGKESIGILFALVENVKQMKEDIGGVAAAAGTGILKSKTMQRMADPAFISAGIISSGKQMGINQKLGIGLTGGGRILSKGTAAAVAIRDKFPWMPEPMIEAYAAMEMIPSKAHERVIAHGAELMQKVDIAGGMDKDIAEQRRAYITGGDEAVSLHGTMYGLQKKAPKLTKSLADARNEITRLRKVKARSGGMFHHQEIQMQLAAIRKTKMPEAIKEYIVKSVMHGDDAGAKAFLQSIEGTELAGPLPGTPEPLKAIVGGKRAIPPEEVEKKKEAAFTRASLPLKLDILRNEQRALQYAKGDERRKFWEKQAGQLGDELKVIEGIRETNKLLREIADATKQQRNTQPTMPDASAGVGAADLAADLAAAVARAQQSWDAPLAGSAPMGAMP